MKNFSERLTGRMEQLGLNQSELARRLETSQSTVSRWLRGSMPTRRILADICVALECTPKWLAQGIGEPAPPAIGRPVQAHEGTATHRLQEQGGTFSQDDYRILLEHLIELSPPDTLRKGLGALADRIVDGDYQSVENLSSLIAIIRRIRPEILETQKKSYLPKNPRSKTDP